MKLLALFSALPAPVARPIVQERVIPFRSVPTKVYAIVEAYTVTGDAVLPLVCYDEDQASAAEARYATMQGIGTVITTVYQ